MTLPNIISIPPVLFIGIFLIRSIYSCLISVERFGFKGNLQVWMKRYLWISWRIRYIWLRNSYAEKPMCWSTTVKTIYLCQFLGLLNGWRGCFTLRLRISGGNHFRYGRQVLVPQGTGKRRGTCNCVQSTVRDNTCQWTKAKPLSTLWRPLLRKLPMPSCSDYAYIR
jgi:hypothetical protein